MRDVAGAPELLWRDGSGGTRRSFLLMLVATGNAKFTQLLVRGWGIAAYVLPPCLHSSCIRRPKFGLYYLSRVVDYVVTKSCY